MKPSERVESVLNKYCEGSGKCDEILEQCNEIDTLRAKVQELEKSMQSVLAESRERYDCSRCEYIEQIAKRALEEK